MSTAPRVSRPWISAAVVLVAVAAACAWWLFRDPQWPRRVLPPAWAGAEVVYEHKELGGLEGCGIAMFRLPELRSLASAADRAAFVAKAGESGPKAAGYDQLRYGLWTDCPAIVEPAADQMPLWERALQCVGSGDGGQAATELEAQLARTDCSFAVSPDGESILAIFPKAEAVLFLSAG